MPRLDGRTAMILLVLCSTAALPVAAAPEANGVEAAQSAPPSVDRTPAPSRYDQRTIENLYYACEAEKAAATSWCSAYLMGAADTLSAFSSHKAGLCGATYKIEDLGPIFMEWVREHQELKDLEMLVGVSLAFRELWPCS